MVLREGRPVASECIYSYRTLVVKRLTVQYLYLFISGETEVQVGKLKVIQQSEW